MARLRTIEHKRALVMRLKRVEGQLRGLQRLIEDEADCEAIAQQLSAARRALDKTHHSLLGCLIETRLTDHGVARAEVKQAVDLVARFG